MTDPFVSEIRLFGFTFPPRGWAFCDGQILPISQNTALFSLLGTTYGGDGKSTFALPDLRGAVPVHAGQGPAGSLYDLGQSGGSDTVTLLAAEAPGHTHAINASSGEAGTGSVEGQLFAAGRRGGPVRRPVGRSGRPARAVHGRAERRRPAPQQPPALLTLNFCIALQGVFPPRQ